MERRPTDRQTDNTVQSAHRQRSVLQGWRSAPSCQPCSVPDVGCRPPSVQLAPQFSLLPFHLLSHLLHETPQSSPVPRLARSLPSRKAVTKIAIRSLRFLAASQRALWQHSRCLLETNTVERDRRGTWSSGGRERERGGSRRERKGGVMRE